MKLALVIGGVLFISIMINIVAFTKLDKAKIELQTAVNNQAVLESTITQQNNELEVQLETQRQNQERITALTEANDQAREEVSEMRNTFARHDLNNLAIAKPGLIEGIVNRGTAQVLQQFIDLTDPRQFDEVPITE